MSAELEKYVKEQEPQHQKVIQRLRRIVKRSLPAAQEQLKWGNPCYVLGKENICAIYVISDHVNLGFFRGVELKDKSRLLEGTGKGMRHVKIRNMKGANDPTLENLVKQAARLAQTKR